MAASTKKAPSTKFNIPAGSSHHLACTDMSIERIDLVCHTPCCHGRIPGYEQLLLLKSARADAWCLHCRSNCQSVRFMPYAATLASVDKSKPASMAGVTAELTKWLHSCYIDIFLCEGFYQQEPALAPACSRSGRLREGNKAHGLNYVYIGESLITPMGLLHAGNWWTCRQTSGISPPEKNGTGLVP